MIENIYDDSEASKWVAEAGDDLADQELALRVYTSRIIGQNPDLVMHGGGNTSVKVLRKNLFGDMCKVMHVKGSGWDLDTILAPGLPGLWLDRLRDLRKLDKYLMSKWLISNVQIYWTVVLQTHQLKLYYMLFYPKNLLTTLMQRHF